MKLLFIDTETNGLPISRFAPYTSTGNWPEIVQISWQVVDSVSWETIDEYDAFLKPYGIWSKEAERVHQIPESIVTNFGKNKTDVFTSLKSAIDVCDYIIAHNMTFDKTVIRITDEGHFTIDNKSEAHDAALCEFFLNRLNV